MKFVDDSNVLNIGLLNTTFLNSPGEWYITVPSSVILFYTVLSLRLWLILSCLSMAANVETRRPNLLNRSYVLAKHGLKLTIRKYPAIHTNYIISHCTTLLYNHMIRYLGRNEI